MKCPKCSTNKQMCSTHARAEDGSIVPTFICSPCGCNILKDKTVEINPRIEDYKRIFKK